MKKIASSSGNLFWAALLLLPAFTAAKESPELAKQREADTLKRALSALESMRAEKLEALEQKEAVRWEARYKAAAQAKEAEEQSRALEDNFGRLAGEAGRLEDELVKARAAADEKKDALTAAQEAHAAFAAQARKHVDEAAAAVSSDFPIGMEARTLAYSRAGQFLSAKSPDLRAGLEAFFQAGMERMDLARTDALETRQTVFEDGRAATVWRLRLGTLFAAELEKQGNGASQILLRTGTLQGRTFAWRQNLAGDNNLKLREAVSAAAQGQTRGLVPFDVLQFKSTGSGFVRGEERTAWARFREWFKGGGVTLYPLFAVGLLALFMIVERLIFFARRSVNAEAFMGLYWPLAQRGDWKAAGELCARSKSSLARVMRSIAEHAGSTRATAEKSLREVLLKEIPGHEKRLSLLAAMGTAAPLLGLLGTVSGLVTLFKVLNQLGTNDPKVLAGGISEALVNTETGLAIAIPVLLVHGWLQERVDELNATLSSKSLEVMNKVWPKE